MDSSGFIVFLMKYLAAFCRRKNKGEFKMKKWRTGIVIAVVAAALVGSTTAYAAGYGGHHRWYAENADSVSAGACPWESCCWRYTDGGGERDTWHDCWADVDGDGICDLCGRAGDSGAEVDMAGACDHHGAWRTGGGHHGGRHCRW